MLAITELDWIFLHDLGANDKFHTENIQKKSLEEATFFHFDDSPLMKPMYVDEGDEFVRLMWKTSMAGVTISLYPV